jgi:tetratricopeptide (TPR) repeat protein
LALADLNEIVRLAPEMAEVWLVRANFYRDLGRADDEMADVKKALSLAPDNLEVQQRALSLALAADDRGLLREAEGLLRTAIKDHPANVDLKVLMGELQLRKGTSRSAQEGRRLLGEATRERPDLTQAWELLGRFELAEGRPGDAMDVALRGLTQNPNNRPLLLLKADAEAQRSPLLAVPTLKELLRQDPNDMESLARLAEANVNSGRPEKVQEQVQLLQQRLEVLEGTVHRQCEMILAVTLARSGQIDRAVEHFQTLMEADPNDPTPLRALAQIPGSLQQISQWSEWMDDWARRHPEDVTTPVRVAFDVYLTGGVEGAMFAETVLKATLQRHPESLPALRVLADLMLTTDRAEESAALNRRILEIDNDNLIALNNLAWFLCEDKGQYDEALKLASRGRQIEPQYLDLIDTRGVIYYRLGRFDEAIKDFTEFLDLCPINRPALPVTRFHLARAYAEMGRKVEAIQQLELMLRTKNVAAMAAPSDVSEAQLLLDQLQKGS